MKLRPRSPQILRNIKSTEHREGFSLMEMLVVMAIISILAVLGVSSFSSLRTVSLTSSGNQIVDMFAMARQNSIAKNAYTAVVIKSQGASAYSAYCLLELTRLDDGSLGEWTAVTPWRYLGQGIVFETGQPTDTFISSSVSLPKALPTSFPFQGQQLDLTTSTVYQCYQPDGTLSTQPAPSTRMVLRVVEGKVDSSSGGFTYQGLTVSGKQVSYYDLVFVDNTGITKIERP
jgi:prepilin-type N-terminal cleavage/methylation domain-containing protein